MNNKIYILSTTSDGIIGAYSRDQKEEKNKVLVNSINTVKKKHDNIKSIQRGLGKLTGLVLINGTGTIPKSDKDILNATKYIHTICDKTRKITYINITDALNSIMIDESKLLDNISLDSIEDYTWTEVELFS